MNYKTVTCKPYEYKRVIKNFGRFGWECTKAYDYTETETKTTYEGKIINDTLHVDKKEEKRSTTTTYIELKREKGYTPFSVGLIELFFSLIFFIRKVIGFFLPVGAFACGFSIMFLRGLELIEEDPLMQKIFAITVIAFGVWLILRILEDILSKIAEKMLDKHYNNN